MSNPALQAPPAARPSWFMWAGLAVVLAAAAVLSFDGLRSLAISVSIPHQLAWLVPIAIDCGAEVACAVWLAPTLHGSRASRLAAWLTWSLFATTVVGNAGHLGMQAMGVTPPWWVSVLVGAIPPAVAGMTVHLLVLMRYPRVTAQGRRDTTPVPGATAHHASATTVTREADAVTPPVGPRNAPALGRDTVAVVRDEQPVTPSPDAVTPQVNPVMVGVTPRPAGPVTPSPVTPSGVTRLEVVRHGITPITVPEDLEALSVTDLRSLASQLGVTVRGSKAEIAARIRNARVAS